MAERDRATGGERVSLRGKGAVASGHDVNAERIHELTALHRPMRTLRASTRTSVPKASWI